MKPAHPPIKMTLCESSNIHSHGYNPDTRTLRVQFKDGGAYHYHDVAPAVYENMKKAKSLGSFLHANFIKPKAKATKQPDWVK